MNTQRYIKKYLFGLALILSLFTAAELQAQVDLETALIGAGYSESEIDTLGVYNMPSDENLYRANYWGERYFDLVLPETIPYAYLYVRAEGADGGKKQVKEAWGATRFTVNAGEGATITGLFEIGTGTNQLAPGDTLRFIIGEKGPTRTGQTTSAGAGGGGTAVLHKSPRDTAWHLLVTAGGGGGAYSDCCTVKSKGKQASITRDGSGGYGASASEGGTGGSYGGGAGAFYQNNSASGLPKAGWLDGNTFPSIAPTGGRGGTGSNSKSSGGWGFGGGASGSTVGGGGGGYSGGGDGGMYRGGGGGSSYINEFMAIDSLKTANGTTSNTQNGYVDFQFRNTRLSNQIQSAANTDKCLDLYKGITDNGNNIQLYECTGRSPQQWIIDGLSIRLTKNTDKCVNLKDGDMDKGYIQLRDCYDKARQDWIYDGISGAFRSGKNPAYCMDLENGSTANDTDVRVAPCKESSNSQQWLIDGVELVDKSGVKTIHLAQDTDMCLDLYKGDTGNSTSEVQLYQCTGRSPQQWVFDGLRIKYNAKQEKCLNLDGGNTADGTKIKVRDCYDDLDMGRQQWIYDGLTQTFRSGKNPDKCLTVDQGNASTFENDQKVKLYDCNRPDAQRWVIED